MKIFKLLSILILLFTLSCSKDEPCECLGKFQSTKSGTVFFVPGTDCSDLSLYESPDSLSDDVIFIGCY